MRSTHTTTRTTESYALDVQRRAVQILADLKDKEAKHFSAIPTRARGVNVTERPSDLPLETPEITAKRKAAMQKIIGRCETAARELTPKKEGDKSENSPIQKIMDRYKEIFSFSIEDLKVIQESISHLELNPNLRLNQQDQITFAMALCTSEPRFPTNVYTYRSNLDNVMQAILRLPKDRLNVNTADTEGRTLLMYAIAKPFGGRTPIIESLLTRGADIGIKDSAGHGIGDYITGAELKDGIVNKLRALLDDQAKAAEPQRGIS